MAKIMKILHFFGFVGFECEICQQAYKYKGDLSKHMRLHLGDDMYKCPSCPKRFRIPYELERHKYEHYTPSEEEIMETN